MRRWLTLDEVLELHRLVIEQSGGGSGVRDMGSLASAVSQPQASFGGQLLYPSLAERAAAIGFSLIANHPFIDGNKRIGHAAMETFLLLNGFELRAEVDEQESVILTVASGRMKREDFAVWVRDHLTELADA